MELPVILLIFSVLVACCHGDYTCLCNYNVEIPVYSAADGSSQVFGYLYEFDCKNLISESNPTWLVIEFEQKMGYIETNGQVKIQTCPGNIPDEDRIKSTTVPMTTLLTTGVKTSKTETVASSFSSAKTASLSTSSTSKPSTSSTFNPSTSSASKPSTSSTFNPLTSSPFKPSTSSTFNPLTSSTFNPSTSSTFNPSTSSTFNRTSLSSSTLTFSTHNSVYATTTIPGSGITSEITRRNNSTITQYTKHSSKSISPDVSTRHISNAIFTTATLYSILSGTNSSTKALTESSTSNNTQRISSLQTSIKTLSTRPETNSFSELSSSNLSTFTNSIIPHSSSFTNDYSANLASTSISKTTTQNPSTIISSIQFFTTSINSHSITNEFGSGSTPATSSTQHSSISVPTTMPTFSSTHSKSPLSSSSTITKEQQASTQPLENYSSSTRVPLPSSSDQSFIKNSTYTTAKIPVSDRVDLCPYRNLALTVYNRTTSTYPLFRQYGSYCYELRLNLGNWFEAQRDCVSRGGELVVISNDDVQERVFNLTSSLKYETDVWIGLHDLNLEGYYEWVNGKKLAKTSFNKGILINPVLSDAHDCVLMDGNSGVWKNAACKTFLLDIQSYPWVCQYKMT